MSLIKPSSKQLWQDDYLKDIKLLQISFKKKRQPQKGVKNRLWMLFCD